MRSLENLVLTLRAKLEEASSQQEQEHTSFPGVSATFELAGDSMEPRPTGTNLSPSESDEQWAKRVMTLQQQNDELRQMMDTQRKALSRGGPEQSPGLSSALEESERRCREAQNRIATLSAALAKVAPPPPAKR